MAKEEIGYCLKCGMEFINKKHGRMRKYCSDECRHQYNNKNRVKKYTLKCEYCESIFNSIKERKYCSNNCYIRDRYWRKEDAKEVMNKILKGEKVDNIPKWLREKIQDS